MERRQFLTGMGVAGLAAAPAAAQAQASAACEPPLRPQAFHQGMSRITESGCQ